MRIAFSIRHHSAATRNGLPTQILLTVYPFATQLLGGFYVLPRGVIHSVCLSVCMRARLYMYEPHAAYSLKPNEQRCYARVLCYMGHLCVVCFGLCYVTHLVYVCAQVNLWIIRGGIVKGDSPAICMYNTRHTHNRKFLLRLLLLACTT